ncbi:flagellar hook-length control protein FliK [Marinobacter daqiaonensis]|uniref:Flagellar hook-length control protein FliK n=1 Tax=Marinobacter daqiaonensis TaxID=650891 RepID=A0A1I6H6F9_9GAMM|nr:flagellar hook-length control protein FliK [Marinobacter daqiaonensis]SFR50096.1 flagellar hook-length control protein FliK [Marinobacter daqiaonensis]
MSGMVLTQLLNPESGIERVTPDRSGGGAPAGSEAGPSRYQEIVRQQEKRLDQRRQQERAEQKTALAERQQERADQKSALVERRQEGAAEAGSKPAAEPQRPGEAREHVRSRRDETPEQEPEGAQRTTAEQSPAPVAGNTAPQPVRPAGALEGEDVVLPFAWLGAAMPANDQPLSTGVLTASAGGVAPVVQSGNGLTAGNELFAALLEGGRDGPSGKRELLAGLQSSQLQALGQSAADGGGKPAEVLTAQLTSRFSGALDLAGQQLNNPGALKGPEAQALMRSYSTSIDVPVGANEWGDKVMGKLAWLTASQMSVAEIHITPPDLGPLEVRVQVQNDQATVTVHAATPAVREQLELHGHRLRDMLAEQGIGLEGFDVSDSGGRDGNGEGADGETDPESPRSGVAGAQGEVDPGELASGELDLSWKGEVDLYA